MKLYNDYVLKNCGGIKDKTIVVTGADGSIGEYICYYCLLLGAKIIMAVPAVNKGEAIANKLKKTFPNAIIEVKYIDLNKLDTIKPFVETIKKYKPSILVNNAGVYHLPKSINSYGIERTFCINYFGPHLLTELMLPIIEKNEGKIVNQCSISTIWKTEIDFNDLDSRKCNKLTKIYGRSKRMVMYDSLRLKRLGKKVDLCHPGASATGLFNSARGGFTKAFGRVVVPLMKMVFMSPSKASLPCIYAITHDLDYGFWCGPRGSSNVWGYPGVQKIKPKLLDEKKQKELFLETNSLINAKDNIK